MAAQVSAVDAVGGRPTNIYVYIYIQPIRTDICVYIYIYNRPEVDRRWGM